VNGTGKSTLMRIMAGQDKDFAGEAWALLEAPDMLLLDEPTNHLDAETIAWLQQHLIDYKGTILIVTHDRYFLDAITGWILELDRGSGIPHEGNYSSWLEAKAKRLEREAKDDKSKQRTLERELEWMRQGAKARQAKSKARISAYNDLATVTFGDTVQLSYVDQSRDALDSDTTVWEEITGGAEIIELGDASMNSRAYCSFEGDAHVEWFQGNFEDYEEDKKSRLGADALEPKRMKHKKFSR